MRASTRTVAVAVYVLLTGCDNPAPGGGAMQSTPSGASESPRSPPPTAAAEPPEIIVEHASVEIGKNHVVPGRGLTDRAGVFLRGAPAIDGHVVDVVAMRDASPSDVASVVDLLRQSKAAGINVKSEARDSTTQALPLGLPTRLPDCATVAWIAKDASIDVWPVGGGTAKRILRGLGGPDLTLGMEAMRKEASECEATQFAVGADDGMTWGLVFDLAMAALHQPWTRTSAAVLVTGATPGRKLVLP